MDPKTSIRQPFIEAAGRPFVVGLGVLLLALVAFQILQIYRYRAVVIRNDLNANQLAQAREQHTQAMEQLAQLKAQQAQSTEQLAQARQQLAQAETALKDARKTERVTEDDVMKADAGELKRLYLVWKKQLNEIAVANSGFKAAIDELRRTQEADRARAAVLNTTSPKHTYGQNMFVGMNAGSVLKNHTVAAGDNPNISSFNAALGENALATNQRGHSNTAVGTDALSTNNDGSMNVAAGMRSMGSNTSGSGNVAVGASAMYRNKIGQHNSAFGLQALYNLDEGHDNSAFGRDAMFANKRGSWNAAFGVDALPGLESGEGNSAFGGEAGYTEEPSHRLKSGSFNSWFGYQSGPGSLKQVSNSIAIGYRAKNTDSNQTVIGNANTAETILFGAVKVRSICVGSTCADESAFRALLESGQRRN